MPVRPPKLEELRTISARYNLGLEDAELAGYAELLVPTLASYTRLDQLPEPQLPVRYPRTSGFWPTPEENPYGAWYRRCDVAGAAEGPLAGKRVAVKDNVCVAGVPMMNGTAVLEGYVPEFDATVITRLLTAGARIAGKSVCESLCFSGGSHTSDTGPVRNPHDPTRSAGGSSSGSAVLVAVGEVDLAVGGDQGGSIRMPSSWCGIYGLKPTYGLVPYTGVFPIELTLDHTGPMAGTVRDVALMLSAIAGPDGLDPRQSGRPGEDYLTYCTGDVSGMRIGIVREGFDWPGASEKDVDAAVAEAAHAFERLGASVREVSVPFHRDGFHLFNGIAFEGATALMVAGNSMGTNWKGHYSTSLLDAYARGRITRGRDLSPTVKLTILIGQYMQDVYHGRYYAKAQNLARLLQDAYDQALREADVLVMPTTPMKATPIPPAGASLPEYVARALEMLPNTCPFDITGHPAMNVPCGVSQGLPVGMMLVGRHGEDGTVIRAAFAYEQKVQPRPKLPAR